MPWPTTRSWRDRYGLERLANGAFHLPPLRASGPVVVLKDLAPLPTRPLLASSAPSPVGKPREATVTTEQLDLLNPPAQRHSATSRAAARQIREHSPTLRDRVLEFIKSHGPCSDEQIANGLGLNPSTARPRRIELVAQGLVRAHYATGRTSSGRSATLWVAV